MPILAKTAPRGPREEGPHDSSGLLASLVSLCPRPCKACVGALQQGGAPRACLHSDHLPASAAFVEAQTTLSQKWSHILQSRSLLPICPFKSSLLLGNPFKLMVMIPCAVEPPSQTRQHLALANPGDPELLLVKHSISSFNCRWLWAPAPFFSNPSSSVGCAPLLHLEGRSKSFFTGQRGRSELDLYCLPGWQGGARHSHTLGPERGSSPTAVNAPIVGYIYRYV